MYFRKRMEGTESQGIADSTGRLLLGGGLAVVFAGAAYWGYGRYQCSVLSNEVLQSYDDIATTSETIALKGKLGIDDGPTEQEDELVDLQLKLFEMRLQTLADECPADLDAVTAKGDVRMMEATNRILS